MGLPSFADAPFHAPLDVIAPRLPGAPIILDLPTPPSVNRIWRHNKAGPQRVSIAPEYDKWKREADKLTLALGQFRGMKRIEGKFDAVIQVKRVPGDLDNRAKGVLDWLQSRGVVENDKHCETLLLKWVGDTDAPHGCRVTVRACT